jgi:hypothetical protein
MVIKKSAQNDKVIFSIQPVYSIPATEDSPEATQCVKDAFNEALFGAFKREFHALKLGKHPIPFSVLEKLNQLVHNLGLEVKSE